MNSNKMERNTVALTKPQYRKNWFYQCWSKINKNVNQKFHKSEGLFRFSELIDQIGDIKMKSLYNYSWNMKSTHNVAIDSQIRISIYLFAIAVIDRSLFISFPHQHVQLLASTDDWNGNFVQQFVPVCLHNTHGINSMSFIHPFTNFNSTYVYTRYV